MSLPTDRSADRREGCNDPAVATRTVRQEIEHVLGSPERARESVASLETA
jgi:hypothetical protein